MCQYPVCACAQSKGQDAVWPESKYAGAWSQCKIKVTREAIVQADKNNAEIDRKNKRVENQVTKNKKLKIVRTVKNLADDTKEKGKIITYWQLIGWSHRTKLTI